jgi:hypothetical protein
MDARKIPGVIVTPSDWFSRYALDPEAELMLLEPALRQQAIWRRLDSCAGWCAPDASSASVSHA